MSREKAVGGRLEALRELALGYPEAEEGVACEGTVIEKRTVRARGKAFVFIGADGVMLKLRDSLGEAASLAADEPGRYKVGAHGWVTLTAGDASPPAGVLERWLDESYRLVAPRQLVALLSVESPPAVKEKAAARPAAQRHKGAGRESA